MPAPRRPAQPSPRLDTIELEETAGTAAPLAARLRPRSLEDYVGQEIVQYDANGRPIGAVVTDRPDGSNDVAVLAPTAAMRVAM